MVGADDQTVAGRDRYRLASTSGLRNVLRVAHDEVGEGSRCALEWPPLNRTHGWLGGLLLDEHTRGLETQSAVKVDGVVILKPLAEPLENRDGIRAGVHAGVVALERLHERLAHAVALAGCGNSL